MEEKKPKCHWCGKETERLVHNVDGIQGYKECPECFHDKTPGLVCLGAVTVFIVILALIGL